VAIPGAAVPEGVLAAVSPAGVLGAVETANLMGDQAAIPGEARVVEAALAAAGASPVEAVHNHPCQNPLESLRIAK
jgi:hypothetical protein